MRIIRIVSFIFAVMLITIQPLMICSADSTKAEIIVMNQIKLDLEGLTKEQVKNTIIAYEPIWAIGTGKTATSEDANSMIKTIRKQIVDIFGEDIANEVIIQYGGSVKSSNSKELFTTSDIDGGLVGGASLDIEKVNNMIKEIS